MTHKSSVSVSAAWRLNLRVIVQLLIWTDEHWLPHAHPVNSGPYKLGQEAISLVEDCCRHYPHF